MTDKYNKFIDSSHSPQTVGEAIVDLFTGEIDLELGTSEIIERVISTFYTTPQNIRNELTKLTKGKVLQKPRRSVYQLRRSTQQIVVPHKGNGRSAPLDTVTYYVYSGYSLSEDGSIGKDAVTSVSMPRDMIQRLSGGDVPEPDDAYWDYLDGTDMLPWYPHGRAVFVIKCSEVTGAGPYMVFLGKSPVSTMRRLERLGDGGLRVTTDNKSYSDQTLDYKEGDLWIDRATGREVFLHIHGRVGNPNEEGKAILDTLVHAMKEVFGTK